MAWLAFLLFLGVILMKTCVAGHNFIDQGKHITCTKCGLTYLKRLK